MHPPLVTLHLFTVPPRFAPAALARMALDRRRLAAASGLRFRKLLGTGDGRTFTLRDSDLCRWGLLGVWETPQALAAFERDSPVAAAWRRLAAERWRADLTPLRARGRWAGQQPFGAASATAPSGLPVAAITRARLRLGRMRTFWRAVPPVALDARTAPGLRFAIGIGESPVGMQATFSVWDGTASLQAFAYGGDAHREAIRRTGEEGWYTEELFARFAVLQTTGTVGGIDPVRPAGTVTGQPLNAAWAAARRATGTR